MRAKAWRGTRILLAVFFGLLTVWYGLRLMGSDGCFRWRWGCVPFLEVGLVAAAMGGILIGVGISWKLFHLFRNRWEEQAELGYAGHEWGVNDGEPSERHGVDAGECPHLNYPPGGSSEDSRTRRPDRRT